MRMRHSRNQDNELKEALHIRQILDKDPENIDALFQLATMLETSQDSGLQRKVLESILSLEPTHEKARAMLLEMDRAGMGGKSSFVASAQPSPASSASLPASDDPLGKPLVFRYSILHRLMVYLGILLMLYVWIQSRNELEVFMVFGAMVAAMVLPLWFVSIVVEVNHEGIKVSRLFGVMRQEIPWGEMENIKTNIMGQGVKITTHEGKVVELSSQIHGYPVMVDILLNQRPELFDMTRVDKADHASEDQSVSFTFSGTKVFQKGALAIYGAFLLLIPACFISMGAVFVQPLVGLLAGVFIVVFWVSALTSPHTITVEGNQMSTKSLLKQKSLTAEQIKQISLRSVRTRRGIARTFLAVELQDGSSFRLSGFPEGNEILYGSLKNWWAAHQPT